MFQGMGQVWEARAEREACCHRQKATSRPAGKARPRNGQGGKGGCPARRRLCIFENVGAARANGGGCGAHGGASRAGWGRLCRWRGGEERLTPRPHRGTQARLQFSMRAHDANFFCPRAFPKQPPLRTFSIGSAIEFDGRFFGLPFSGGSGSSAAGPQQGINEKILPMTSPRSGASLTNCLASGHAATPPHFPHPDDGV